MSADLAYPCKEINRLRLWMAMFMVAICLKLYFESNSSSLSYSVGCEEN